MFKPFANIDHFTPGIALARGLLIGAAAELLMSELGGIAGIFGMVQDFRANAAPDHRAGFLIGLIPGDEPLVGIWLEITPGHHGLAGFA